MTGILQRVGVAFFLSLGLASAGLHCFAAEKPATNDCASLLTEALPSAWIKKMMAEGKTNDPLVQRARDAVQRNGFTNAALNREITLVHNEKYTHELAQGPVTNQKQSGRCWIFAALNMLRSKMIAEGKVPANFEFSESYLHFFNMLEKSNRYLEGVIEKTVQTGVQTKLSKKELRGALDPALGDGGWYEYFKFLVAKYGMAPKEAMPDTKSAEATAVLLTELKAQLAATAGEMLTLLQNKVTTNQKVTVGDYTTEARAIKERGMAGIWKILATHLGDPPSSFEFRQQGAPEIKNGVRLTPTKVTRFTPWEFANDFAQFNPDDYVVVTAYPRRREGVVYEQKNSAIGAAEPGTPKFDVRFMNVSMDRLEQLTIAAIEGGQAVWFAADIHKDVDHTTGIMHPKIYDRAPLYNMTEEEKMAALSRRHQALFGVTGPNHAMVLTGFDRPDPNGPVIKFKNENSWGDVVGSKGTYHLYREWFENVFQIIVHKRFLSEAERQAWSREAEQIPEKGELF